MVLSVSAPARDGGHGWDVGWAAAFLASDEARSITGATLPVESGVLSVTPLMMAPHLRCPRPPVPSPILVPVSDCVPLARVPEAGFP